LGHGEDQDMKIKVIHKRQFKLVGDWNGYDDIGRSLDVTFFRGGAARLHSLSFGTSSIGDGKYLFTKQSEGLYHIDLYEFPSKFTKNLYGALSVIDNNHIHAAFWGVGRPDPKHLSNYWIWKRGLRNDS